MTYFIRVFDAEMNQIATLCSESIVGGMRKAKKISGAVNYKIWNEKWNEFGEHESDYISYTYNYNTKKFKRD